MRETTWKKSVCATVDQTITSLARCEASYATSDSDPVNSPLNSKDGTGSPGAITAAVKLLDTGRGALLDGRQVSAFTQAKVSLAGFASVEQLALVEDTRAEFLIWVKDVLVLDALDDPSCKLEITTLVGCWLVTDAEASSSRWPKVVPRLEHLELRAKFEKLEYNLEEALTLQRRSSSPCSNRLR